MANRIVSSVLIAFALLLSAATAEEKDAVRDEEKTRSGPVAISARQLKTASDAKRSIEITLVIGKEYEIYSARKHKVLLPMRIELLDAKRQPIKSDFSFPKPKTVPLDEALGGDYHVYAGHPKITGVYSGTDKPAYVRVHYRGYSLRGY